MTKLEIVRPHGSLYFDPDTAYLRINYRGMGPGIELTEAEMLDLEAAIRSCRRKMRPR